MDYQKAINILRCMMNTSIPKETQGISTAISAMRKLQMYRDGKLCLIPESVYAKQCAELDAYKQLGTMEEVRNAVEKQKEERPRPVLGIFGGEEYECRECGNTVEYMDDYCKWCGQKLNWSEVEE